MLLFWCSLFVGNKVRVFRHEHNYVRLGILMRIFMFWKRLTSFPASFDHFIGGAMSRNIPLCICFYVVCISFFFSFHLWFIEFGIFSPRIHSTVCTWLLVYIIHLSFNVIDNNFKLTYNFGRAKSNFSVYK